MSRDELLSILNEDRKKFFTIEDISKDEIKLSLLKKIDKVFNKGLDFYLDFSPIDIPKSSKVFFRKKNFHNTLSIEDKRIVDSFESLKSLLDGYRNLTETSNHTYPYKGTAKIEDNPKSVALKTRNVFIPKKNIKEDKEFLKGIIAKLAEINVYVFEFVETWNKKDRATIDGVYIEPNVIVLKRQKYYKREIFTLAHEIGHYLLGIEDIEAVDMTFHNQSHAINKIEKWCNDFAFYLIVGDRASELERLTNYSEEANQIIDELTKYTHISKLSCYTKLANKGIIGFPFYKKIIKDIEDYEEKERELKKVEIKDINSNPRTPKPIISPLYLETMQLAFYNGLVSEAVFRERLKIPENLIDKYL